MKLIAMTLPYFFIEEHQILTALFDEGLELLHLRKPNAEPVFSERLLALIPSEYRERIVVHDHFYLKDEYRLKGIHLNERNPEIPKNYKGHVSASFHTPEEVVEGKKKYDYVFFSPIFDSISKPDYHSPYTPAQLRELGSRKVIDKHVMALGGITLENIERARDYGFGGAVVLGSLWQLFDRHNTADYKGLISYFRRLRKAAG